MKKLILLLLFPFFCFSQDLTIQQDKVKHFEYGALAGALTYVVVYDFTKSTTKAIIYGTLMSLLVGGGKEIYDNNNGGKFDPADLTATTFGGFSACVTITIPIKFREMNRRIKKLEENK